MIIPYNSKIFRSQNALCSHPHDTGTKRGGVIYSVSHSRSLARPGIVAGYLETKATALTPGPLVPSATGS